MKRALLMLIGLTLSVIIIAQESDEIRIEQLGIAVNTTTGCEYVPVITADGNTLYFCGRYRSDGIGGEDIYVSHRTEDGWSPAEPVRELCTKQNEGPMSISADGTKMVLFVAGMLYTSTKGATGWQKPELMSDKINISAWNADAMITSDGKAMLFAAKQKTDYEDEMSINIFVSLLNEEGEWSDPIDLGPTINTSKTDRSPVLHPDMKTLYFSTDGRETNGGLDVYMSTRLREDSWTEWSEPVSLGDQINTTGTDCWYKISTDGTLAYFAKEVENGMYDLYSVSLPKALRPTPVATISGKLVDLQGNPVITTMRWEDLETHKQVGQSHTDPADGSFFIVLPQGKNYGYYIDDDTHFPIANNIDLRGNEEAVHIEKDITVPVIQQMIEEQLPMPLNNLFFDTNESTLQSASENELMRVVDILKQHPYRVEIGGHTDNIGSDAANQHLSEARAKAVRDYLVKNGIEFKRLSIRGYGESHPIASNDTEEGRSQNRRVEIRFLTIDK